MMPWNVDMHKRKFLLAHGRYLDRGARPVTAGLVLWGEWEPPSRVVRRWAKDGRLPRALHSPYWSVPQDAGFRQNTDPWIWGGEWFYSCCKQTVGKDDRPTSLQSLIPGSVICFGSTVDGDFCVDTVFVVASSEPWVAADADKLRANEAFITCTVRSVANSPEARVGFTLYRGATFESPLDGMFSFVPARRVDDPSPRFSRPPISVDGLINPATRQSTWGSKRRLPVVAVTDAWSTIKEQVIEAGLVLAVSLDAPPRERSRVQLVPTSKRSGC
jgi:hypothetical protein